MDMSNIAQLFQKNILLAGGRQAAKQAAVPGDMLQKLAERMIGEQQGSSKADAAAKAQEIELDAYDRTDDSKSLEEMPREVLEYYLHVTKMFSTSSGRQEQDLLDFKERLQGMDETIQGYRDILDGKSALAEGLSMEDVMKSLSKATQERERFVKDGIAHLNKWSGYFVTSDSFDGHMQKVLGENLFAGKDRSNWTLDPSASDLYSEIDRVLAETHRVTEELDRGVRRIYDVLESRGLGDKYQNHLEAWRSERGSYFDQIEAKDVQRLIQENLMRGPLQEAQGTGGSPSGAME